MSFLEPDPYSFRESWQKLPIWRRLAVGVLLAAAVAMILNLFDVVHLGKWAGFLPIFNSVIVLTVLFGRYRERAGS